MRTGNKREEKKFIMKNCRIRGIFLTQTREETLDKKSDASMRSSAQNVCIVANNFIASSNGRLPLGSLKTTFLWNHDPENMRTVAS